MIGLRAYHDTFVMRRFTHPFKPLIFPDSKILILGTFPSLDSFKYNFYYAHKRNQFWKILEILYHDSIQTQRDKIALLQKRKLALWDIVASCERVNSSDANLKKTILHDIPTLLKKYPSIQKICFTGQKASALYQKEFKALEIECVTLPSPSPAYAKISLAQKCAFYQVHLA